MRPQSIDGHGIGGITSLPSFIGLLICLLTLPCIGCGSGGSDDSYYSGDVDFRVRAVSVSNPDEHGNGIRFSVTFNEKPDFFVRDEYGRAAYAFQFYIAQTTDLSKFFFGQIEEYDAIIQGGQIYVANDIVVRDGGPPHDDDSFSSGWGAVTTRVPYWLHNKTVTFYLSTTALGVEGPFAYLVQTLSFGATAGPYFGGFSGEDGHPLPVPSPPPVN